MYGNSTLSITSLMSCMLIKFGNLLFDNHCACATCSSWQIYSKNCGKYTASRVCQLTKSSESVTAVQHEFCPVYGARKVPNMKYHTLKKQNDWTVYQWKYTSAWGRSCYSWWIMRQLSLGSNVPYTLFWALSGGDFHNFQADLTGDGQQDVRRTGFL